MKSNKRSQPHDRLFRELLEDTALVTAFLRALINPNVRDLIDWSTLQVYDTAFFGADYRARFADAVYKAMTHAKEAIVIIVNHETKPDSLLPIRKHEYVLGALRKLRKQKIEPDFIYFVTWQSGDKIPENHPKSLCDYFKNPELARKLLLEDDVIVAQEVPDEKLLESGEASLLLIFMKYARSPKFLDWLKEHKEVAEQFAEHKYIDRALIYLLEVGDHDESELRDALKSASEKLEDKMLTTGRKIENRGRREGRREEKYSVARNMLNLHLGIDVVQQATGLSRQELSSLLG